MEIFDPHLKRQSENYARAMRDRRRTDCPDHPARLHDRKACLCGAIMHRVRPADSPQPQRATFECPACGRRTE